MNPAPFSTAELAALRRALAVSHHADAQVVRSLTGLPKTGDDLIDRTTEQQLLEANERLAGYGALLARVHEQRMHGAPSHGDTCTEGMRFVLCKVAFSGQWAGWLFVPHADRNYVSAAKLDSFSIGIVQHALARVSR